MYILGVNSGWHDSSAALLRDGELVVLIENDRVSRTKHAMWESPSIAVEACLSEAGVGFDEIEAVAVGWDDPVCMKQNWEEYEPDRYREGLLPAATFGEARPPIEFVPHHLAHAASGIWTSGYDRAAVLVLDGRGETVSTSLGVADAAGIEWLETWDISQSLGNYYGYAADWAGFGFWAPGKLMGLASYGRAEAIDYLKATAEGYAFRGSEGTGRSVSEQEQRHQAEMMEHFAALYPFAKGSDEDIMAHANFAASVQGAVENAIRRLAEVARERTGADRLVITGGVGLNCTMNGKLTRDGPFAEVYVPPVTSDTGVSLGAALVADRKRCPRRAPMAGFEHAYWGVTPSEAAIDEAIRESGLASERLAEEDLVERVVDHLCEGRIVAWFQGRAEIGQRALGARSILCDPRDRSHLVRVNTVKGREVWRPLAPSVLEEAADEFFEGGLPRIADFMLAALPVRREAQSMVPVNVHVDGTARPQTVRRSTNPRYWRLIDTFRRRTGVGAVMNTSFNLAGEPIVHTPGNAISSFIRSDIDVLALGDNLIVKPVA